MLVLPPDPYLDGASIGFKGAEVLAEVVRFLNVPQAVEPIHLTHACRAHNCFVTLVRRFYGFLHVVCLAAFPAVSSPLSKIHRNEDLQGNRASRLISAMPS